MGTCLKGSQSSTNCRHDMSIGRPLAALFVEHRRRQSTQRRVSALHTHDEERADNARTRREAFESARFGPPPQPRRRRSITHDASKSVLVFIVPRLERVVDTQEVDESRCQLRAKSIDLRQRLRVSRRGGRGRILRLQPRRKRRKVIENRLALGHCVRLTPAGDGITLFPARIRVP